MSDFAAKLADIFRTGASNIAWEAGEAHPEGSLGRVVESILDGLPFAGLVGSGNAHTNTVLLNAALIAAYNAGKAGLKVAAGELHTNFPISMNGFARPFRLDLSETTVVRHWTPTTAGINAMSSIFYILDCVQPEIVLQRGSYDPLPYTQGTITAKGDGYFDFLAAPGFAPAFAEGSTVVRYDPDLDAITWYGSVSDNTRYTIENRGDGVYRAAYASLPDNVVVGDQIVIFCRKYNGNGVLSFRNSAPRYDVQFESLAGMGIFDVDSSYHDIRYRGVPRPGGLISSNADGVHLSSARGVCALDVVTSGLGDDGMNLHSDHLLITAFTSETLTVITSSTRPVPRAGDELDVYDSDFTLLTTVSVTAVAAGSGSALVTFSGSLPVGFDPDAHIVDNRSARPTLVSGNVIVNASSGRAALVQVSEGDLRIVGSGCRGGVSVSIPATVGFPAEGQIQGQLKLNVTLNRCCFAHGVGIGESAIPIEVRDNVTGAYATTPVGGGIALNYTLNDIGYGGISVAGRKEVSLTGVMRNVGLFRNGSLSNAAENDIHVTGSTNVRIGWLSHLGAGTAKIYLDVASTVYALPGTFNNWTVNGGGKVRYPTTVPIGSGGTTAVREESDYLELRNPDGHRWRVGLGGQLKSVRANGAENIVFDGNAAMRGPILGVAGTDIVDAGASVNTSTKYQYSLIINTTSNRLMFASGGTAGAAWVDPIANLLVSANNWGSLQSFFNNIALSNVAGTTRGISFRSSGTDRFFVGLNSAAESGSNAGSDYIINRYNDGGGFTDTPLRITRSTGDATFAQSLSVGGPIKLAPYTVATLPTVGTANRICVVTDANAPTWNATLTGGGSTRCLAFDNGTNWTAH